MGRPAPPENAGLFVGAGCVVASEQTPNRASAARKIRSLIRISEQLSPNSTRFGMTCYASAIVPPLSASNQNGGAWNVYKRHLETELPPHPAGGGAHGSGSPAFPENAGLFVGAGLVVASEQTPSRASAAKKIRSFIRISLGEYYGREASDVE
jgi:hypothetical protein